MAEIFISYKSERRKAAEHLAAVLVHYGYSVWFDYQLIKGRDFGLQIDRQIREAKALVVLWCSLSVGSRWVAEEVDLAHNLGILVPVKIEPCELPVGFRRQDYIDMSPWDGAPRSHELDPLIRALAQRIGRPASLSLDKLWEYEEIWRRFGAPSLEAFALGTPVVEDDRRTPQVGITSTLLVTPAPVDHRHELMALAAREWPAVRDSADPQRLERFERHFAGTFHAEEARARREEIKAEARRQRDAGAKRKADAWRQLYAEVERQAEDRRQLDAKLERRRQRDAEVKRQAEGQQFRAAGRTSVQVGDHDHNKTQWILPDAGEAFCDLDGGPEMAVVPAGSFEMGSRETEPERSESEGLLHKVRIAQPFAVGRYAVTRGQFAAFVNATGHKAEGALRWTGSEWKHDPKASWRDPRFRQDDSHPVTCVN
jgi:TIR domain/Sulfatase-modifying factor enzyme 1